MWRPSIAMTVYILEGFFAQIPQDLFDAARMDGYSDFEIFWRITLPIGAPAIFTTVTLNFIILWNEFLYAVVLLTDDDKRTLPLGHHAFHGQSPARRRHDRDRPDDRDRARSSCIYAFFSETMIKGMTAGRRCADAGSDADMAVVTIDGSASATTGSERTRGQGREPDGRGRRVHGAARPVGLRQIVGAAHDRRARADHRRARSRSTAGWSIRSRPRIATSPWCSSPTRSIRT